MATVVGMSALLVLTMLAVHYSGHRSGKVDGR